MNYEFLCQFQLCTTAYGGHDSVIFFFFFSQLLSLEVLGLARPRETDLDTKFGLKVHSRNSFASISFLVACSLSLYNLSPVILNTFPIIF